VQGGGRGHEDGVGRSSVAGSVVGDGDDDGDDDGSGEDEEEEDALNRGELKKMSQKLFRSRRRMDHIPGVTGGKGDGPGAPSMMADHARSSSAGAAAAVATLGLSDTRPGTSAGTGGGGGGGGGGLGGGDDDGAGGRSAGLRSLNTAKSRRGVGTSSGTRA
jgi:hypothetical protein